jgi:hypothetical protein
VDHKAKKPKRRTAMLTTAVSFRLSINVILALATAHHHQLSPHNLLLYRLPPIETSNHRRYCYRFHHRYHHHDPHHSPPQ